VTTSKFGSALNGVANSTYVTLVAFRATIVGEDSSLHVEPRTGEPALEVGGVAPPVHDGVPGRGGMKVPFGPGTGSGCRLEGGE
jgi:hypothetical protein